MEGGSDAIREIEDKVRKVENAKRAAEHEVNTASRNLQEEEIDPFADIYASDGPSIWTREGEKVANPNAFTSDW